MKDTPLPFTVLATITIGFPFVAFASSNAFFISSKLCPSMFITCHPKASNFLSIG